MNAGHRRRFVIALATGLAISLPVAGTAQADPLERQIIRVIDGDDIELRGGVRVRLCGIDAPELGRPGGPEARDHLRASAQGQQAHCLPVGEGTPCDGRSRPRNGKRVVAQCHVGGADLAAAQVSSGHARDWPKYSGGFYAGR